jgi:hypothetical protein
VLPVLLISILSTKENFVMHQKDLRNYTEDLKDCMLSLSLRGRKKGE